MSQSGSGKCSICGSPRTSKSTCPLNPNAKNPNPSKHPLAKKVSSAKPKVSSKSKTSSKSKMTKVLPKHSKLLQLRGPGSMPKPSVKSSMLTKRIKPKYINSLEYFDCISTGNDSKFNELIKNKVDTNVVNDEGDTPLIFLLKDRYANELGYMFFDLLALSIKNIDIQNNNGETALMWACYNCNVDYIQEILEVGANPDIFDNNGITALNIIQEDCDDYSELIYNSLYYKKLKATKMLSLGSALSDRLGKDSVIGNLDPETFRMISAYYGI